MRHGSAARTGRAWLAGHQSAPRDTSGSMLRIAAGHHRAGGNPFAGTYRLPPVPGIGAQRPRCMRRAWSAATRARRLAAGIPCCRAKRPGCPGCGKYRRISCCSIRERARKNAPGCGIRGRSRILGRSGSPTFRGKVSVERAALPRDRRTSGDARARARPGHGRRAVGLGDSRWGSDASWESDGVARRGYDEGRARYARIRRGASPYRAACGFPDERSSTRFGRCSDVDATGRTRVERSAELVRHAPPARCDVERSLLRCVGPGAMFSGASSALRSVGASRRHAASWS